MLFPGHIFDILAIFRDLAIFIVILFTTMSLEGYQETEPCLNTLYEIALLSRAGCISPTIYPSIVQFLIYCRIQSLKFGVRTWLRTLGPLH